MNGMEIMRRLSVSYRTVLCLLHTGRIPAHKEKGVWLAEERQVQRFKRDNDRKINELKQEYVSLYWQGLSPEQLQQRVRDDIASRLIVVPWSITLSEFAERAIYEDLMSAKKEKAT